MGASLSKEQTGNNGVRGFNGPLVRAWKHGIQTQLVIAKTDAISHVEDGKDASLVKKEFFIRDDLIGEVSELSGDNFAISFRKK